MAGQQNQRPSGAADRRRFLGLVGGSIIVGSATAVSPAVADEHDQDELPQEGDRSLDEAFAWDVDMAMQFSNQMQLDGDPAGEGRENVVHITSHGEESSDYPCGAVDIRDRSLTLGDVSESGALTYDYYKGDDATYQVPDEVFLILRTTDEVLHVAYRKKDAQTTVEWHTRDVSSEFLDDGWRAIEVGDEDVDEEDERITTTFDAVGDQIMNLRTQDTFADLLDRFGEDAALLAVAIGNGSVEGVVSDAYFHDLRVTDDSYVIPAMLCLEPEFDRDDDMLDVSLSFATEDGSGDHVSLETVDDASVRMAPYTIFSPPFPGSTEYEDAIDAQTVDASPDTLEVGFDETQATEIAGEMGGVCIFGAFDLPEPHTFVAIGDLE